MVPTGTPARSDTHYKRTNTEDERVSLSLLNFLPGQSLSKIYLPFYREVHIN